MTSLGNGKTSLKFQLVSAQPVSYTFCLCICKWQTHCNWALPFCLEQWKGSHQHWMSIMIDKHGVHAPHFLSLFYSIKWSQWNLRHDPWLVLNILVVNKRSSISWISFFQYVHFKLIKCFFINLFSNIFCAFEKLKFINNILFIKHKIFVFGFKVYKSRKGVFIEVKSYLSYKKIWQSFKKRENKTIICNSV